MVLALNNCSALVVIDPASMCAYGIDLSAHASPGTEIRTLESSGSQGWVSTNRALLRLEPP